MAALEDVKKSGRKLILVTGRHLDDLQRVFPEIGIFNLVVAENGDFSSIPREQRARSYSVAALSLVWGGSLLRGWRVGHDIGCWVGLVTHTIKNAESDERDNNPNEPEEKDITHIVAGHARPGFGLRDLDREIIIIRHIELPFQEINSASTQWLLSAWGVGVTASLTGSLLN